MNTTPPDPRNPGPLQPGQPAATPPQYAAPVTPPAPVAPPSPAAPPHWQAQQPVRPQPPVMPQSPTQAQPQPVQPQFPAPPAYPVAQQAQYPQGFPPPSPAHAQPTSGNPYAQPYGLPQVQSGQQFGQQAGYTAPGYGQQPPAPNYGQVPVYPGQPGQQGYPGYAMMVPPGPGEPFDGAAHPDDLTRPLYGATIGQALSRFFKNYASFSGRASRSEYWWVALVFGGGWFVFSFLVNILGSTTYSSSYGDPSVFAAFGGLILLIVGLGVLVPSLALTWRRLHDANLAGPFYFLGFVFPIGGIILLILAALPPKVEGRRFFRNM